MWAFDFQFDQTADGRALKLLNIVDEFTREALVMLVARSIDADTVVAVLERLVAERGAPELLRCDNGPEMTAHALRDWCVLSRTGTAFIEPGSPWQNPFVESFHSRVRDELLDVEEFSCLAEARVVIGDWREDYNRRRPHSALGMKAPAVFAAEWATTRAADGRLSAGRRPGRDGGAAASAPRSALAATLPATRIHQLSLVVDRETGSGQRETRLRRHVRMLEQSIGARHTACGRRWRREEDVDTCTGDAGLAALMQGSSGA